MAAGLGFKTFTTGEVLTAADTNGYLMQGVLVFASTAARDAAITAPAEGQFCFTKDTNTTFFYDGAAWVVSGATGDIEGVTAGTGISGGGTSGTVTITNSMATEIDAKGDLIVGTGADTFSRLAVGTDGHTLVADSSTPTGLAFAAPAGGGDLVRVANTSFSAVSSQAFDSVFTSSHTNYLLVLTGTISTGATMTLQMRALGSTNTNTNYIQQRVLFDNTTVTATRVTSGATSWSINLSSGSQFGIEGQFYDPQVARDTYLHSRFSNGGFDMTYTGNRFSTTTQFDGFIITPSAGTITGQCQIYGVK